MFGRVMSQGPASSRRAVTTVSKVGRPWAYNVWPKIVFIDGFLFLTVSKLKVYDKKNCTRVFVIDVSSHVYGGMILGVFEVFCRGISGRFSLGVHRLQDAFLGTWTRATCVLGMSRGSP